MHILFMFFSSERAIIIIIIMNERLFMFKPCLRLIALQSTYYELSAIFFGRGDYFYYLLKGVNNKIFYMDLQITNETFMIKNYKFNLYFSIRK